MTSNLKILPRHGIGLVEMLISLVIVSTLLLATGVALTSAVSAYNVNSEHSMVTQNARVTMHRIVTAMRTSEYHAPDDVWLASAFAAGTTVTGSGAAMLDPEGTEVIFRHDSTKKQILAIVNGTSRVMANGVESFTITMEPMKSDVAARTGGGWDLLKRASVSITMYSTDPGANNTKQRVTLVASATARRNAW
jgi:type II secretory pathway pseudopilin PulG